MVVWDRVFTAETSPGRSILGWGKAVDPLEHDGHRTLMMNHGPYALRAVDLCPVRGPRVEVRIDPSLRSLGRQSGKIFFLSRSARQNQPPPSFR